MPYYSRGWTGMADMGGTMVWALDGDTDDGALTDALFIGLVRHHD
jgi:hypothetical protein